MSVIMQEEITEIASKYESIKSIKPILTKISEYSYSADHTNLKKAIETAYKKIPAHNGWIHRSFLIYYGWSVGIESLEKITGYKRSRLFDFKKAGESLCNRHGSLSADSVEDFLRPKDKPKNTIIENIREIGFYEYRNIKFTIYCGETGIVKKKVFFKTSDDLSAATVKIEVTTEIGENGKEGTNTLYKCGKKTVKLYDFETRPGDYVNIKADR